MSRVVAGGLLLSMFVAAVHDASQAWDGWSYHLPFAARLWGLVKPSEFVFSAANSARFAGFPLLAEWLQGLLWRTTGLPTAANLLAYVSVPALAVLMYRRYAIPWQFTVAAMMAIPLVQIHATSCYIDLPANCAATALVMITLEAYVSGKPLSRRSLLLAFGCAAVASNMKSLLHPILAIALLPLGLRQFMLVPTAHRTRTLWTMLILLPVVFATPLKNLTIHHNPYYPVRMTLVGHHFSGAEDPYSSSPLWLQRAPRPLRFAASVLELGSRPLTDPHRWSIDQWAPRRAPDYRMGGFFGAYVLVQVIWLVATLVRRHSRETIVTSIGFGALTVVIACMPQSHELRYYMVWMLVLVSINLWHLANDTALRKAVFAGTSLAALAVVLLVTRGGYAYASGLTFSELVRGKTNRQLLTTVPEHGRACVVKEPFSLLWAAPFHPPLRYAIIEADAPQDCHETLVIK